MKFITRCLLATATVAAMTFVPAQGAGKGKKNRELNSEDPAFFATQEARRIGDQVLLWQRVTGGWPKNVDMCSPMSEEEKATVASEKGRRNDSTTDNNATNMQLAYLARLYKATGDTTYRDGFRRGVEYLLSGQYENGGWPQFWPEMRDYQIHITYNDNAMVRTMWLIRELMNGAAPYDTPGLLPDGYRRRLLDSFYRGVECILATQITDSEGRLGVWCQQHYRDTYLPAPARAYELPSYCSNESVGILHLLMDVPRPDDRIKRAVHAGMKWLDDHKITGYKYVMTDSTGFYNRHLEKVAGAGPIWARFYDLEHGEPYVCDRDGIPRRHLEQIGYERRNGYGWYSDNALSLYGKYHKWARENDPEGELDVRPDTPGGNERGIMLLDREDAKDVSLFDAVVSPGESIQAAISKAPGRADRPYKILVRKGLYNEKVIIDRPGIVLVGEDRDSTRLVLAEKHSTIKVREYGGKPTGNGVIVLQEGADDCLISGLTVYNNYGTTVEKTTTHQMAIFGRATRTIIVNCNIAADGNDALSLWSKAEGGGMYYHADLDIRCKGVDFLCPRGYCFATRCRLTGDGHALIWHDGRADKNCKLVITDSDFDSETPSPLGRYHHDSQFFLMNCRLSERVLDEDIRYAYTDKVLDPCPWGKRVYYLNCHRDGGHSGWLADNFEQSEERPVYHEVKPEWVFGGKWDPEKRIRDLWDVVKY